MIISKEILRKFYIAAILMIAALIVMPQFCVESYGVQKVAAPAKVGTPMEDSSWKITQGGTYRFTGSTTTHYITVETEEAVTIILENVKIDTDSGKEHAAIDITDNAKVKIKLEGTNYLHGGNIDRAFVTNDGYAAIRVKDSAEVTILGNGSLEAHGGGGARGAAGIGGNYDADAGKITIGDGSDSPTVIATGGGSGGGNDGAAGIGGGYDGMAVKGITINSGTVTATGGNGAAGIGGGQGYGSGGGGKAEKIEINGGTVTATGGEDAAGIGGGECGAIDDGGNVTGITITGGTVTATGGEEAAGIGGSKDTVARDIKISGGKIIAKGGKYGAGIGAGNAVGEGGGGAVHGLTITGGEITATGGKGAAGIGGGDQGDVDGLNIAQESGKTLSITATGGSHGAGIGNGNTGAAGNEGVIQNDIGSITITLKGGSINATGGYGGAGIGGGNSKADNITIKGYGNIKAKGLDESCAIGAGFDEDGGNITIEGSGGGKSNVGTTKDDYSLVIEATTDYTSKDNDAAVIGGADSGGDSIYISHAYITLYSKSECAGAGIGAGANKSLWANEMDDITISYCYINDVTASGRYAPTVGVGRDGLCDNIRISFSTILGAGVGGCNSQAAFFDDPTIDSIKITNSKVTADVNNRQGNRAAIGSGCYEAVDEILIDSCNITANSTGGAGIGSGGYYEDDSSGELNWKGGACGDVTIKNSVVSARGGEGGAGIGGGWGTSAGDITIDNSIVSAVGSGIRHSYDDEDGNPIYYGGAGIGSGSSESCGSIEIKNNSTVTANGDYSSAGIGSSGSSGKRAKNWEQA